MPFKEVAYTDDLAVMDAETGLVQSILLDQSPIIKLWSGFMVIKLAMMFFLLF